MSETKTETRVRQPRQIGRVYDFDNGVVTLSAAFDKDFKLEVQASKVADPVARGFVLQSIADYIAQEVNEVMKAKRDNETDEDHRARAIAVAHEAYAELVEGKVDFRTGMGLGGMRSVIGALGQVLFELGKTFVKNQRGETLSFTDLHSAREAVKALYQDTTPKGPFEPMLDKEGKPVLDKEGNPRQKAVNPDSHLTGRMIFNAICETAGIKEKLDAILSETKKEKPAIAVEMG